MKIRGWLLWKANLVLGLCPRVPGSPVLGYKERPEPHPGPRSR